MKDDIAAWIALSQVPALGPARIKKLWEQFCTVDKIYGLTAAELAELDGFGNITAPKIMAGIKNAAYQLDHALYQKEGVEILSIADPRYPALLRHIYDPPTVLYVKGSTDFSERALAVVGTRGNTQYGKTATWDLIGGLPQFTIVSGLAEGIDTEAHLAALAGNKKTVAVLASGLDIVYPYSNSGLAQEIVARGGSIVTEFPLGMELENWNFPRRNRIISGMALGTLVVEAGETSGALITAQQALEQGREVFAVPGPLGNEKSRGTHRLIQSGAKLVEKPEDILEELGITDRPLPRHADPVELNPNEQRLFERLTFEPRHIDELAAQTELPAKELSAILAILEIKGLVEQLPGKRFRSVVR